MDAMTGDATDSRGVRKIDKTNKLVWIFAGSAGLNRDEFIADFYDEDKKVADFFDRIHFDMILPTVQRPGQAILAFLSSLLSDDICSRNKDEGISVTKSVLYLFGQTVWKSARQIKTISRIACAKADFSRSNISLENFDEINISTEFTQSLKAMKNRERDNPSLKEKIKIIPLNNN